MREEDASSPWLHDLGAADRLVLFGLRAVAFGHADCAAVREVHVGLLAQHADLTLNHLVAFVRVAAARSRRRLALHAPGCCRVCRDEHLVLHVVRMAQEVQVDLDETRLRRALFDLLDGPACEGLVMATQGYGCALAAAGLHVGVAAEPAPRDRPDATVRTLH